MRLHKACLGGGQVAGLLTLVALILLVPHSMSVAGQDVPEIQEIIEFPTPDPSARITGSWVFADRDDTAVLPARYLLTEVCDSNGTICDGNSIKHTGSDGSFSLRTDMFGKDNVRVKLFSWATYPLNGGTNNVAVNGAGRDAPDGPWWYLSEPFSQAESKEHEIPFDALELPAFWIMDDFTDGMLKMPEEDQGSISVEAYWGYRYTKLHLVPITVARAFFCHGFISDVGICYQARIYFFAQDIRTGLRGDGLTDRLPLHEIGHAVQYYLYGHKLPAPVTDYLKLDLGIWSFGPCAKWFPEGLLAGQPDCAWQEAFGDWWRLYVQDSPITDLNDNLRNYENTNLWDRTDETPGRVTGSLWDMFDDKEEGTDASELGFDPIWKVLKGFSAGPNPDDIDRDFAAYWETWKDHFQIGKKDEKFQCAVTSIYQNAITYDVDSWTSCGDAYTNIGLKSTNGFSTIDELGQASVPVTLDPENLTWKAKQISAPGGIGEFNNWIKYDPAGIEIAGYSFAGTGFAGSMTLPIGGWINIKGSAVQEVHPPLTFAYIYPRLRGSVWQNYGMKFPSQQPSYPYTYGATSAGADVTSGRVIQFRRGDAKADPQGGPVGCFVYSPIPERNSSRL